MSATMRPKRNSLPSLGLGFNKFFVSKRASMFENQEETPQERRDRSPCGALEVSERRMHARKDVDRKKAAMARRKRRADPYEDQSSAPEDDFSGVIGKTGAQNAPDKKCKPCRHASASVNVAHVRRAIKPPHRIGECSACLKALKQDDNKTQDASSNDAHSTVIWVCMFCGHQGCDRDSNMHALQHYRTPRSDKHCLILSTQHWTVWCYECDCEVVQTSCKKLHEAVQMVKRRQDLAPPPVSTTGTSGTHAGGGHASAESLAPINTGRSRSAVRTLSPSSSGTRQRGSSATHLDDKTRKEKQTPKVKGIQNMGNTCFFNSVVQVLGQTHLLTQLFDTQLQTGQRVSLPGNPDSNVDTSNDKRRAKSVDYDCYDSDDEIELKPLELILPEGGALSLSLANFLKEMHAIGGRNNILTPNHMFSQVCKKGTQFVGFHQQDAHELLRCLLEYVRTEELHRTKKAILKAFALSEKTDPSKVAPRVRMIIQGYGRQATHTIIDQIFGGQLISTVVCDECQFSSQVFEPFMDLSLSVSEDKGKPKDTGGNEESLFDCFGRPLNNLRTNGLSKLQLKKQKKLAKKNRGNKNSNSGRGAGKPGKGGGASNRAALSEDIEVKKRLTERSRPEDEVFRKKQQEEEAERSDKASRVPVNGVPSIVISGGGGPGGVNESIKYKVLMQARTARRKDESGGDDIGDSSEPEEDEELEYDHECDLDDYGMLNKSRSASNLSLSRSSIAVEKPDGESESPSKNNKSLNGKNLFINKLSNTLTVGGKVAPAKLNGVNKTDDEEEEEEEEEEEDEEESGDDEDDEDDEETDSDDKNGESDTATSGKKKENCDADEEDNAESEWHERMTRHPSIVVVDQSEDNDGMNDANTHDGRYLSTSASCDQLNYNSASDTSERYFTCDGNGHDTGDDLDTPYRRSHSKDSLLRAGTDDVLARKLCELKLQRHSSSKESLHRLHLKRPSAETLNSFRSCDRLTEEEDPHQPAYNPRKFRQEWLNRSLTTLAPTYQSRNQECSVMSCLAKFTAPELLVNSNKIICENCTKLRNISGNNPDAPGVVRSPASKQMMIVCPPAVLTLQFKRFHYDGIHLAKANRFVHFPLVLDLAPYTSTIALGPGCRVLYGLYGIVQHTGRLNNGHYTAFVRSRPMSQSRTPTTYLSQQPLDSSKLDYAPPPRINPTSCTSHYDPTLEELEEEVKTGQWYHVSDDHVNHVTVEKVVKAQAYLLFYERLV